MTSALAIELIKLKLKVSGGALLLAPIAVLAKEVGWQYLVPLYLFAEALLSLIGVFVLVGARLWRGTLYFLGITFVWLGLVSLTWRLLA